MKNCLMKYLHLVSPDQNHDKVKPGELASHSDFHLFKMGEFIADACLFILLVRYQTHVGRYLFVC